ASAHKSRHSTKPVEKRARADRRETCPLSRFLFARSGGAPSTPLRPYRARWELRFAMRSGVERVGPGPPAETATAELDGFDSRERPRGFPKEFGRAMRTDEVWIS